MSFPRFPRCPGTGASSCPVSNCERAPPLSLSFAFFLSIFVPPSFIPPFPPKCCASASHTIFHHPQIPLDNVHFMTPNGKRGVPCVAAPLPLCPFHYQPTRGVCNSSPAVSQLPSPPCTAISSQSCARLLINHFCVQSALPTPLAPPPTHSPTFCAAILKAAV